MNRGLRVFVTTIIIGMGRTAHAEESDHDRAVALFADARKLIEAGDCSAAIPKLEESIAREPSIGARFSLADCTQGGDPYAAFWHLREAALLAFVKHDERIATAEERAAAIVKSTGGLLFDIEAVDLRAPGFDVRLDDRSLDRFHLSAPIAVPPGDHHVAVTVADGRHFEGETRVTKGSITRTRVVLVRSPATVAPPVASPPPPIVVREEDRGLSGRRTVALGLGGAGIAALAVATAFGVVALEKRSELDRACNGDRNACTGSARVVDPVIDSADRNATISTILFAAGGALLAGGIVLWITDSKAPSKNLAVLRW